MCMDPLVHRSYFLMKTLEMQDLKGSASRADFSKLILLLETSEVNLLFISQYVLSAHCMLHAPHAFLSSMWGRSGGQDRKCSCPDGVYILVGRERQAEVSNLTNNSK